jgi:hypothetical protein
VVDHLYSLRVGGKDPKSRIRRFNVLYSDALRLGRSHDLDEVLGTLEQDLKMFVAMMSPSRLFVHAGVVGWRGRAILFPGRSFSGKTTLVSAMVKAGAVYYSDEYAVLDARGRVHPFARALHVRDSGTRSARRVSVESLGGRAGRKPLPVGLVVSSRYEPGGRWRSRRLSPAQGMMRLLANTVSARIRPHFTLSTLARTMDKVPAVLASRGDAADAVRSIVMELENRRSNNAAPGM